MKPLSRSLMLGVGLLGAMAAWADDAPAGEAKTRIVIEATDLRSDKGKLLVWLFRSKDGFPDATKKASHFQPVSVKGGKAEAVFDVAPGEYAVSTCHDEDDNGKCNANFLGIPTEGVACSNTAHKKNLIPQYEKAKLAVPAGQVTRASVVQYNY